MSRPLRFNFPGAIHHVTSRGNGRQNIVTCDLDRQAFVRLLGRTAADRRWILHSWVLMTNHLHLVVETPTPNLSSGMRDLLGCFAARFNRVHGRVGHLFQHRFDTRVVERERHLLELVRYVPLNPVRCGLVQTPARWKWSSYRATAGFDAAPSWLEIDWTLGQFDPDDRANAQALFRAFVADGKGVTYSPENEAVNGSVLGSSKFCENVQRWIDSNERSREHPIRQRRIAAPALQTVIELVKRELALTETDLKPGTRGAARKLIVDLGHNECGLTFQALAGWIGGSAWSLSKLNERSRELERDDSQYAGLIGRLRDSLTEE